MKFRVNAAAVVVVMMFLALGLAMANVVTVSSNTATTIAGSNSGRQELCVENVDTNPVYLSKTTSSATVAAGMIIVASSTPFCLQGYKGSLYGLAGAGASGSVRTLESLR